MIRMPDPAALCEALFASDLQPSDRPAVAQVRTAINVAIECCGGDCSSITGIMAYAYGRAPDLAAERMTWCREQVANLYACELATLTDAGGWPL